MPKSKPPRGKKYIPQPVYGNRVVPAKPKWMRMTKTIGIIVFSILTLMAIAGLLIRHYNHIKFHK